MKVRTPFLLMILFVAGMAFTGCVKQYSSKNMPKNTVFYNSFEFPQDTINWYWAKESKFTSDTPPGGGKKALRILGNLATPAASFLSQRIKNGGYFTIQCWGKMVDIGGYIELATITNHEKKDAIHVSVLEEEWHLVSTADTLYCPPNSNLMLSIQAGLLMDGTILVDMLQIKKVKRAPKAALHARR